MRQQRVRSYGTCRRARRTIDPQIIGFGRRGLCCKVQKRKAPAPRSIDSATPSRPAANYRMARERVPDGRGSETAGGDVWFFPPARNRACPFRCRRQESEIVRPPSRPDYYYQ